MWPRVDGLRTLELGSPGDLRDRLTALVLEGRKRATASLLSEYAEENEDLEHIGEYLVVLGNAGERRSTIVVTDVDVARFADVSWEFADAEGEGYTSIDHWRDVHRRFWVEEEDRDVTDDTPVVCLRFNLVEPASPTAS
jgi:uncharacterized protein YhfF